MRYRLVVFDWDGTLMDSTAGIAESIRQAARDLALPVPAREVASHVIGLGLRDSLRHAVPTLPEYRYAEFVDAYRRHFAREHGDVAGNRGVVVGADERRPCVQTHPGVDGGAHLGDLQVRAADGDLVDISGLVSRRPDYLCDSAGVELRSRGSRCGPACGVWARAACCARWRNVGPRRRGSNSSRRRVQARARWRFARRGRSRVGSVRRGASAPEPHVGRARARRRRRFRGHGGRIVEAGASVVVGANLVATLRNRG